MTMKISVILFLLISITCVGQEKTPVAPTDHLIVTGEVEKEVTIHASQLDAQSSIPIGDVVITNHAGEPRGTAKGLKGVRVSDVLSGVHIKAESPKVLSEYYFTFVATDGYAVVFSWNELFNSPTGANCYFITEKEGKRIAEIPERILVLTPSDYRTGRRHIKGLQKIVVSRTAIPSK